MQAQQAIHAVEEPATQPAPLRSIKDIVADLSKPLPERHLKTRKQGGKDITYVEWHTVIKFLDHFAPGWSCEVKDVIPTGTRCVVTVRISIPCLEGIISREATGTEDEELKAMAIHRRMPRRWRSREQLQSLGWEYISTRSDL
jgi:hypothetical protein